MELREGEHGPMTMDDQVRLGWLTGLHFVFIVSGVLLAFMDWLMAQSEKAGGTPHE